MSVVISSHLNTKSVQRALNASNTRVNSAVEKLSSGKRINRAGDDVASLSISAKIESETRSIDEAQRNIMDFVSLLESKEATYASVTEDIQNVRELYLKLFNGSTDPNSDNVKLFKEEIVGVLESAYQKAEENGINGAIHPFDGSKTDADFTFGSNFGWNPRPITPSAVTPFESQSAASQDDQSINIQTGTDDSSLKQIEFFDESLNYTTAMRYLDALALRFDAALPGGANPTAEPFPTVSKETDLNDFDIAIDALTGMRTAISASKAGLLARFDSLESRKISLSGAKSHYEDADFAQESTNLIKSQIQQDSSSSMLSQANAQGSFVLSLLP
ncbi:MAG: flagellin [Candidatus Caenarcaniphilales bacterium]|nr:flagellin [Candidatus Caenarcaniphilales bacterium]